MFSVIQFSDLHIAPEGFLGFGGLGPDTGVTWAAVVADAFPNGAAGGTDRVVVTGDVTQHGNLGEYHTAAKRLAGLPVPANVLTGNHDFQLPAEATLPSSTVSMNRAERFGDWMMLYVDTNDTGVTAPSGQPLLDHPERHQAGGSLSRPELEWLEQIIDVSDAEHIWLWMHHTPGAMGAFARPTFTAQIDGLLSRHPRIRGIGSGHVHDNETITIGDRPVFVCPSMTLNFDVTKWRTLPPGYRTYEFADDGTVTSDVRWVEPDDWQSFDLPDPVVEHLRGDLGYDEMLSRMSSKPAR